MPLAIVLSLAALLLAGDLLLGDHDAPGARPLTGVVAQRVEALRELRFRERPKVRHLSPESALREARAEFQAWLDPEWDAQSRALPTRLGLMPADFDAREALAPEISQYAGCFDGERGQLTLIESGAGTAAQEAVLAHELVHALEDDNFIIELSADYEQDAGLAEASLQEGTATEVESRYVERHMADRDPYAACADDPAPEGEIPPFLEARGNFPYTEGAGFVRALLRQGGGTWRLVDRALRERPPVSTEQVMHVEKYLQSDHPLEVENPQPRNARRVAWATFGEFATRQLLIEHGLPEARAGRAAAGWGGDQWAYWLRGDGPCPPPCAQRGVFTMTWEWDADADAREFTAALLRILPELDRAAVGSRGRMTRLVLAPTYAEAAALSRR